MQQLASAISAKQARGRFARTAQSVDDVAFVKVLFRRVSSLLEVFQVSTHFTLVELASSDHITLVRSFYKNGEQTGCCPCGKTAGVILPS